MAIVHIGIGSNIGDREANCRKAISMLTFRGIEIKKTSSMYKTEPWGFKDQPEFINMVMEAETSLSPDELLQTLKDIENSMGRKETIRWGPRIIDLDILFYDDLVIDEDHLKIPHPLIQEREFVLIPMCEIAPNRIHPVLGKTILQIKKELKND